MNINEYMRSFSDNELQQGAELYFSDEIFDVKITPKNKTGKKLFDVKGSYYKRENNGKTKSECEICLDDENGIIMSTRCMCETYRKDLYGCAHTAAILTAFLDKENGENFFRSSKLETMLKNAAMVEDPFAPGVLKKTDDRLLSIMMGDDRKNLPVWKNESLSKNILNMECSFSESNYGAVLQIRVGKGKKQIIVKDLPDFLECYNDKKGYMLGKNEYLIAPECFSESNRKVLDYLTSIYMSGKKQNDKTRLFLRDPQSNTRYMLMEEKNLDNILYWLNGEKVEFEFFGEKIINFNKGGLEAKIVKKAYGASFSVKKKKSICCTSDWIYFCDDEYIYRICLDRPETFVKLQQLLDLDEELYIRESDMPRFEREILYLFRENGIIENKGVKPENYEREKPSYIFKFDYIKNTTLTCRPYVYYESYGEEIPMYDNSIYSGRRDGDEERKIADKLNSIFESIDNRLGELSVDMSDDELNEFMALNLPWFEEQGEVYITETLKKRRIKKIKNLSVGVRVDGEKMLLSLKSPDMSPEDMTQILSEYNHKKKYYKLKNGDVYSLGDIEIWDTAAELYQNYGNKASLEKILVPLYRALYIEEMLGKREDVLLEGNKDYKRLIEGLNEEKELKTEIPKCLEKILRPYQREGVLWLAKLKKYGFGGVLADDMGLGKTLQVLAFLLMEKESGKEGDSLRTLIVCPASLVYNWEKEIKKYTPQLSTLVLAGTARERKELLQKKENADIYITSYDLLKRDIEYYEGFTFANEIIDEAQYAKNHKTQAAQTVRLIDSGFKVALTGTPIENHLSELWSIMDYIMPGFLYGYSKFQKSIEIPVVAEKDENTLDRLRRMVHPFILRRLKKDVLKDLPDKIEEIVTVKLTGKQKELYDANVAQIKMALDKTSEDDFNSEKIQYLAMLTKLRQISCGPSMLYDNYDGESAKMEACMELIREAMEGGHKILLFSQFTSMLDIIGNCLKKEHIAYHRIDGSTPKEKRIQMVDAFSSDDVMVFCISLKAGGTGLNLTAADIVIHFDPWWNLAAQNQATDRAHRIGQKQKVTVYEIIAENTIEEKIQKIKNEKAKLAEDVLSGDKISGTSLNREDLMALLE